MPNGTATVAPMCHIPTPELRQQNHDFVRHWNTEESAGTPSKALLALSAPSWRLRARSRACTCIDQSVPAGLEA